MLLPPNVTLNRIFKRSKAFSCESFNLFLPAWCCRAFIAVIVIKTQAYFIVTLSHAVQIKHTALQYNSVFVVAIPFYLSIGFICTFFSIFCVDCLFDSSHRRLWNVQQQKVSFLTWMDGCVRNSLRISIQCKWNHFFWLNEEKKFQMIGLV